MKDSLAPFKGVNAIPCPLGMDIEYFVQIECVHIKIVHLNKNKLQMH